MMVPAASQASDRTAADQVGRRSTERGPRAEKPATLHAVKVPVSPDTKANAVAITELVSGVVVTL